MKAIKILCLIMISIASLGCTVFAVFCSTETSAVGSGTIDYEVKQSENYYAANAQYVKGEGNSLVSVDIMDNYLGTEKVVYTLWIEVVSSPSLDEQRGYVTEIIYTGVPPTVIKIPEFVKIKKKTIEINQLNEKVLASVSNSAETLIIPSKIYRLLGNNYAGGNGALKRIVFFGTGLLNATEASLPLKTLQLYVANTAVKALFEESLQIGSWKNFKPYITNIKLIQDEKSNELKDLYARRILV